MPRTIHRVSIGPLQLGDLALGQWRHLTEEELSALQLAVNPPIAQVLTHSFMLQPNTQLIVWIFLAYLCAGRHKKREEDKRPRG